MRAVLAEIVAGHLDEAGLVRYDPDGVTGNVGIESVPDKPDTAVGIFSLPGLPPDVTTGLSRPGLQVIVRGNTLRETMGLVGEIYSFLDGNISLGSPILLLKSTGSQPVPLGNDETGRSRYTFSLSSIFDRG